MTDQSTTTHDQGPEHSPDVQLAARRDLALAALRAIVPADEIGEGHRVRADGELLVTHLFPATARGSRGWEWYVTLTRVPGSEEATVCESGMLPGEDALLAPAWVPWSERVLDSDHDEDREGEPGAEADGTDETEESDGSEESDSADGSDQKEPEDSESEDQERPDPQERDPDRDAAQADSRDRGQDGSEQRPGIDPAP
ncbi:DUF3027 domain-containing protein [Kocuria palustris]|uniref:DUF3027 domain-containing protein n=1 Tax=Kocuria palustris TaxID=71999 RepID=UPI00045E6952|nr:DUF3027 domain-containing protein [Kocuria palustris]MBM7823541.1 hypothetical protein [Kocuria palustris]